jgi:hypothetical protein
VWQPRQDGPALPPVPGLRKPEQRGVGGDVTLPPAPICC